MTKDEAMEKVLDLHDRCIEELATYREEMRRQGQKYFGLDGPKTEIEKKYDRMIKDIISQIDQ